MQFLHNAIIKKLKEIFFWTLKAIDIFKSVDLDF